jgi:hypothetical protein
MKSRLPSTSLSPYTARRPQQPNDENQQFTGFSASELYCPTCKTSMPVREKLLLTLASGDLYDYVCKRCGTTVGKKTG